MQYPTQAGGGEDEALSDPCGCAAEPRAHYLRRVPLLSTVMPPPQQLRWGAETTYRVQYPALLRGGVAGPGEGGLGGLAGSDAPQAGSGATPVGFDVIRQGIGGLAGLHGTPTLQAINATSSRYTGQVSFGPE
jgi:hypothetical protein